jgi:biopolymer transport protein TolR
MATRARRKRMMAEINVVPYIDVMLVLLIIFMVTTPLLTQGVSVSLPKAGAEPLPEAQKEPILISIDQAGRLYVNLGEQRESPVSESALGAAVKTVLTRNPAVPVLIKADEKVPYGRVIQVMVLLQKLGASKVGFVTDPSTLPAGDKSARLWLTSAGQVLVCV